RRYAGRLLHDKQMLIDIDKWNIGCSDRLRQRFFDEFHYVAGFYLSLWIKAQIAVHLDPPRGHPFTALRPRRIAGETLERRGEREAVVLGRQVIGLGGHTPIVT